MLRFFSNANTTIKFDYSNSARSKAYNELKDTIKTASLEQQIFALNNFIQEELSILGSQNPPRNRSQVLDSAQTKLSKLERDIQRQPMQVEPDNMFDVQPQTVVSF